MKTKVKTVTLNEQNKPCAECGNNGTMHIMVKHVTEEYALNLCGDCLRLIGPLRTPTDTSALNAARAWAQGQGM